MELTQFSPDYFEVKREGTFFTLGNSSSSPPQPSLSFSENKNYLSRMCKDETISCIICPPELEDDEELLASNKGIAVSRTPRFAFYSLHNWLADNDKEYAGRLETTTIGSGCLIHSTAVISESGVVIGNNVKIEEYAVIKSGAIIEDNAIIRTGAIIAGENHILTKYLNGNLLPVRQTGKTRICNNAEIGYHSMIAKGTFPYDETVIGAYSRIENSVEISHNSKIGKNVIVTGQCQVCGNSIVGDYSRLNPQSVISNRKTIGNNVTVEIGSVVVNDVKDDTKVAGNFAIEHNKFLLWHRKKLLGR